MSLTLQNLRSLTPGVEPAGLAPGQICFNVADRVMYVGNGGNDKVAYGGTSVPGIPGEGWFSVPLSFEGQTGFYIIDPAFYGDFPLDGEVLTWDADLFRVVWRPNSTPTAYLTTNAAVAAAPGSDLTSKISNAIGATPVSGDSVVVTGNPGDPYQAFYQYLSGVWTFAASYAPPLASEVPVAPIPGVSATTVQGALESIQTSVVAAQTTASTALTVANNALPKAGGTMTGNINFTNGQPVDAGTF